MRSKRPKLEGLNLLDLTPVRVAEWTEQGDVVVVSRPAPLPFRRAPLRWLSATAAAKRLRLDEVGSHAWRAMDGRTTVGDIAADLERTFGEAVEPAVERLGMLVRTMHDEGLVAYRGVDEPAGDEDRGQVIQ